MSLEAIIQAIHAAGEAQVSQVEERARAQVEAILTSARREAARAKVKAFNNAVAPAAKERSRLLHQAKLEALHTAGSMREALVDAALEEARRRLADLRAQPAYRDVLSCLVQEALVEICVSCGESGGACLQIDPRDRAMLDDILVGLQLDLPVQEDLDCWGGLVACSEDGRVVMINTLEARLERATASLRRSLSGLFEAEECQILTTVTPACAP
jgi:vacuolar-type H+-ATPase subunit E/Vma4